MHATWFGGGIAFIYIRRYFGSRSGLFTAGCQPFLFCSGSSMPYIVTRGRAMSAPLAGRFGMSAGSGVANPRAAGSDGTEKNEGGRGELTIEPNTALSYRYLLP